MRKYLSYVFAFSTRARRHKTSQLSAALFRWHPHVRAVEVQLDQLFSETVERSAAASGVAAAAAAAAAAQSLAQSTPLVLLHCDWLVASNRFDCVRQLALSHGSDAC